MNHYTKKVKRRGPQSVGLDTTATTKRPPTVAEFLAINPLPAQLRHLEPALRKLPHAGLLIQILLGCLEYNMSGADFDRIVADCGDMYSQERQRCAGCFSWTPTPHAIVAGKAERFAVVPMCDSCVTRFEAGRATPQMQRNMDTYIGEVGE